METLHFTFNEKNYTGTIITSPNDNYYWLVFDDDEIINLLGDSVAFYFDGSKLRTVYNYSRFKDFINYLQHLVEKSISIKV